MVIRFRRRLPIGFADAAFAERGRSLAAAFRRL
jgi:hypothetical protein